MASRLAMVLGRRKRVTEGNEGGPELARVLSILDLTALGVGSTLGLGVYVLAGAVAKDAAGPAVTLSFLVAAVASAFAGLCYAEFAARVPKAGSAYVYSYVSVGEFVAFIIGWNLILEYVIGTASVARGLSSYIDALSNYTMRDAMHQAMPINVDFLSKYPDFLAFGMIMLLTTLLSIGVKESTLLNNIFTGLNLVTVSIVLVAGSMKADIKNWQILPENIPNEYKDVAGTGGFMPFGVAGVMAGAAKCFYGFVGFDCVATTGEEAKNPQRNIPIAIVLSLVIIFFAYFGISTVLTMMWPYYLQDADAPFPYVFEQVGWPVIKWIVTIGAVFALCTSLLGAMFPLPRVLYAMAKDGLLFRFLAVIHPKAQTPVIATIVSGLFAGLMAVIFDLQQLIDMMSIGTLLAYTIVAICVLVLRYQDSEDPSNFHQSSVINGALPSKAIVAPEEVGVGKQLFNCASLTIPSAVSSAISQWGIFIFSVLALGFCACIIHAGAELLELELWAIVLTVVLGFSMLLVLFAIGRQPRARVDLSFKVPLIPVVPALSVVINVYLMLELDAHTWIRFSVWMIAGFLIYFLYGVHQSNEGRRRHEEVATMRVVLGQSNPAFTDDTKSFYYTTKF